MTLKIIYRSALRPRTPKDPNKRLVDAGVEEDHQPHGKPTKHPTPVPNGEKSAQSDTPTVYIKSRHDDGPTPSKPLPELNPDDLVGRTFLLPPGDNGERLRAKVTRKALEDIEKADGDVENSSCPFILISSLQRSITLLALLLSFLKIACLHVSFTAYEYFYKLSKMHCLFILFSTCWKHPSPFSNVHFRNITKNCSTSSGS